LSVLAGHAYAIERVFDVPAGAFRPSPKVVSSVTRWTRRAESELPPALVAPLKAVLRAGFAHRRQTIGKNLRRETALGESELESLLRGAGIEPGARAEDVPPDAFLRLAAAIGPRAI
jgi:16S rRNA (adenine1518-N6/adenine1519-N6)-dimethyltransferase